MTRLARRWFLVWIGMLLAPAALAGPVEHVVIISIDGGKPSVMRQSAMPNLMGMVDEGAHTWKASTVLPSITLVSHVSMLTGVGPAKHKVLWNDWQPKRGMVSVSTVFGLAKKAGLSTAIFAGKAKFRHLNVAGTVDRFEIPGYRSRKVADAAAAHILAHKPNLTFIHFADPDGAGHLAGWGSATQKKSFAAVDSALGTVRQAIERAGIADSTVVLISADHGGHGRTHGTASPEDVTIPWIAWGAGVNPGHAITAPVKTFDTAATALHLLGIPTPQNWDGKPVVSAFADVAVRH
jgi:predicted AlkP superfamily pyrophosphatase or phosphodiesterase